MNPAPPRAAVRLLTRALRGTPAGPAVLGDLHEDFVGLARTSGAAVARRWYWREALALSFGRDSFRFLSRGLRMTTPIGFHAFFRDCTYAMRSLARSPGFALFTAGVIGLGVGATTTVFSVLKPLTLVPLPFEEPGRLVWISNESASGGTSLSHVTSRSSNLRDFRERATSFEGLTGYNAFSEQTAYTLTGTGEPARLVGFEVAHDFLAVMGVRPSHGRGFDVEEGTFGGPPAVILSFGFWQTRFAADPSIVGRTITLNEVPRTVVGVLPATFDFSSIFTPGVRVHFLTPYPVSDETDNHGNEMIILGRMRPGVTPEAAQAELAAVLNGLREEQPDRWGLGARLSPLQAHLAGPFRLAFVLLAAAAGTLMLIVCVNVSNLLLARAPGRAHEVAVRLALGASRGRVARQFFLESLGIALAGAGVGVLIAWVATRLVAGTAAIRIPLLDRVHMDAAALLFATALAVVTGLLVSVVPAFQVTDGDEASVLRASGRGTSASGRSRRIRETLVVAEVTLACVLLMFGGLLVRSFKAVLDVDLGFDPAEAVVWLINPTPDFESMPEMSGFYGAIADRVALVPGVEAVGLIDALPLGRNRNWILRVVGVPEEEDNGIGFFPHIVDAGYLHSMHTPLVAGRDFTRDDLEETQKVVLMNESGARRVFGEVDAVGRQIRSGGIEREVVGIVQDVRHVSPEMDAGIQVYFPLTQRWSHQTMDMVVRSHLPTEQVAAAVATALREVDPAMPVGEFWTLDFTVDRAMSARRFTLGILTAYGLAALLLAGLGIYGVLAQSVAERNHEIGIRMALGASASKVVRSVLGRTLLLAVVGVFTGAVLSGWATRMVGSLLFGVSATDPATFLGMAAVLLLVATAAGALPAIRAARIRGSSALRAE